MSLTLTDEDDRLELHIWGAGGGMTGVRLRVMRLDRGTLVLEGVFDTADLHRAGVVSHDELRAGERIAELERVIDDVLAAFEDGRTLYVTTHGTAAAGVKRDRLAHWAAVRRGLPALESDPVASNETPPADVPSHRTGDTEIDTISGVLTALEQLDERTAHRVVDYIADRYGRG